jgi:two-component system, OmpR family, response regulator
LRVLLVEDSPVICGLIAEIINNVPGVRVAESVGSEGDAIEAVGRLDVDVVILDLQLRKGTGFGVLRAMRDLPKKPIVVVLTNFALGTLPGSRARAGRT